MPELRALIFDVDGVLVDSPHERAWGDTLARLAQNWDDLGHYRPEEYTSDVYQAVVAGRAREEGAAALLAYFGISDPDGVRCAELCDQKQAQILDLIARGEFEAFGDAVRLLVRARNAGKKTAAASSSKNANQMLGLVQVSRAAKEHWPDDATRLIDLFDANVCGRTFSRGKPNPDIFFAAAAEADVPPADCLVIEDAPSGVLAAKAGGMMCVGIDRNQTGDLLIEAGADMVVTTLDDVALG